MLYFASLNKRVHSFSLTITGLNGVDVSCRSMRFPLPIQSNSSHHYTDSLVAIAFYIEYSPSFVISVKKRARLSKHCCLKSLFRSERPNCKPSCRNCPPPSSRFFVRLVVELGRFAYSFYIRRKYGLSCECRRKNSWVDVPEKRCKIPTLLQSSGSKVEANLTIPTIVPGFRYRYMGVWIFDMVVGPSCCTWAATWYCGRLSRTNTIPHHVPRPHRYYYYLTSLLITVSTRCIAADTTDTTSTNGTIRR
jgi:hypothetical protein